MPPPRNNSFLKASTTAHLCISLEPSRVFILLPAVCFIVNGRRTQDNFFGSCRRLIFRKNIYDFALNNFLPFLKAEQEFLNCIEVDKPSAYIEELISQKKPLVKVLRLMCLQCIASSGLKPKVLEGYKKELFQVKVIKFVCLFEFH